MESKYRKVAALAGQRKKHETSMRKSMAELCSEILEMQLELDAPVLENVQKIVLRTRTIALRMDTLETEYKARIEELERQDPTAQLKEVANKITEQIAY